MRSAALLVALAVAVAVVAVPGPARGSPLPRLAARMLSDGIAAYRAGRYEEAIARFERGYALAPRRELLFALAQAYRYAGRTADAAKRYREFLAGNPTPRQAAAAKEALAACLVDAARSADAPMPAPVSDDAAADALRPPRIAGPVVDTGRAAPATVLAMQAPPPSPPPRAPSFDESPPSSASPPSSPHAAPPAPTPSPAVVPSLLPTRAASADGATRPPAPSAAPRRPDPLALVVAGVGLTAAGAGAGALAVGHATFSSARASRTYGDYSAAVDAAGSARAAEAVGAVLIGAGLATVAGAALRFAWAARRDRITVAATVLPTGVAACAAARF